VAANASAAEAFIEPWAVDLGEIDDDAGHRLIARVVQRGGTQLSVTNEERPIPATLAERVAAFLAAIGQQLPMPKDDPEYLRSAAVRIMAWQQSQTMGQRMEGILCR
jgi:hypothetical protein